MDIVVTIPKRERKNIDAEDKFIADNPDATWFWRIGTKPSNLKIGDRVYFVDDGAIRYYGVFSGYGRDLTCEVTGRTWGGLNLIFNKPAEQLKNPVQMRGFQGFRYIRRID